MKGAYHQRAAPRLVTGTGQDGQYLAELLHEKGYEVFGLVKGQNNPRTVLLQEEFRYVEGVGGDLAVLSSLVAALRRSQGLRPRHHRQLTRGPVGVEAHHVEAGVALDRAWSHRPPRVSTIRGGGFGVHRGPYLLRRAMAGCLTSPRPAPGGGQHRRVTLACGRYRLSRASGISSTTA
jgi:hypothetical protein